MLLADRANQYVDRTAPWELTKDPARAAELQDACTVALNLFRQLVVYLSPVLPSLRKQTDELLGVPIRALGRRGRAAGRDRRSHAFTHMMKRVEAGQVEAMINESREEAPVSDSVPARHRRRPRQRRRWARSPGRRAAGGRADFDRRFHEGRSARGPRGGGRRSAQGQEADQADAEPGRRRAAAGVCRHQERLRAGASWSAGW